METSEQSFTTPTTRIGAQGEKEIARLMPVQIPPIRRYKLVIDGELVDAVAGETFERVSPSHDVPVGVYPLAGVVDAERAIGAARRAMDEGPWPKMPAAERAKLVAALGDALAANADELALIEVAESGKPLSQAREELATVSDIYHYAASLARHVHGDTYNGLGPNRQGFIFRDPVGVVAIIAPWNFPLLVVSQALPFALSAGCTTVLKPSEFTPGTTLLLAQLALEVGIPAGVVNAIAGFGVPIGSHLAESTSVDMIAFTGSTVTGRSIVQASSSNLKRVQLELGGKNPQIVCADADLEAAVDGVVFGVLFNQGECCDSGSRLLVEETIAPQFVSAVVERAARVKVGDPFDLGTQVGAIINDDQLAKIDRLVQEGRDAGAEVLLGGHRQPSERGRFYASTVIDNAQPTMSIAQEEIFGPVLTVLKFTDIDEAIRIANGTTYGLSAGIWTKNLDKAATIWRGLKAGTIWVNHFMEDYAELPYGGFKQSGLGRGRSRHGIEEFTELKSVALHYGAGTTYWGP